MYESPLFWPVRFKGRMLEVLDETRLPSKKVYIKVCGTKEAVRVIREMKTRAFGQFLVVMGAFWLELRNSPDLPDRRLIGRLSSVQRALNQSRPTFPFAEVTALVLSWAEKAAERGIPAAPAVEKGIDGYLAAIRGRRLERVKKLAAVMKDGDCILTHCNVSGELAMAARLARDQKRHVRIFATETRPYFQGSRLTCWELHKAGIDVTLIADNAVGTVMADRLVNKVIVGSDRYCANGDFANKVGTYQIAVLAREYRIPFYVLTQPSRQLTCGRDIPVEMRPEKELLVYNGKRIFPSGVKGFYPGFDVVGHEWVTQEIPLDVRG